MIPAGPPRSDYDHRTDSAVACLHVTGAGKGSGVGVEMRTTGQVCTVRDGKIVRYRLFRTKPEALEAAGLEE